MANLHTTPALKLTHFDILSPARNNNNIATRTLHEVKVGPGAYARDPFTGLWRQWREGVSGVKTGAGAFDQRTITFHATASVLQGPWTLQGGGAPFPVIEPARDDAFEEAEITFGSVFWYGLSGKWAAFGHVGNNTTVRQTCLFWSTDGRAGLTWERDAGNPAIPIGGSGAFDDYSVADPKVIAKPGSTTVICLYAGRPASGFPTIGRATAVYTDLTDWTKTGEVIALSGAPAWRANGCAPAALGYDKNGRLHGWFAGYNSSDVGSIGYIYSDNDGATWSESGVTNPVWSAGGSTAADAEIGDVVQGAVDGDVIYMTCGGSNLASYAGTGGSPLDAPVAAIVPLADDAPARTGKFYPFTTPTVSRTTVTGSAVLSNSVSSILVRFRAYRLNTTREPRSFYSEYFDFENACFLRLQNGAGANAGKAHVFARTPSGIAEFFGAVALDDGLWHRALYRRTGAAAHELWVDGAQDSTDSTNIGTSSETFTKYVGNQAETGLNEPSLCTISDVVTILGTAVTWEQAEGIWNTRTFPGGVSATIDFPTAGSDAGSIVIVEAQGPDLNNRRLLVTGALSS